MLGIFVSGIQLRTMLVIWVDILNNIFKSSSWSVPTFHVLADLKFRNAIIVLPNCYSESLLKKNCSFVCFHLVFWLYESIGGMQELLFSYNIAVDRSDEMKKVLNKSAASVGLRLPDVYQPWQLVLPILLLNQYSCSLDGRVDIYL